MECDLCNWYKNKICICPWEAMTDNDGSCYHREEIKITKVIPKTYEKVMDVATKDYKTSYNLSKKNKKYKQHVKKYMKVIRSKFFNLLNWIKQKNHDTLWISNDEMIWMENELEDMIQEEEKE